MTIHSHRDLRVWQRSVDIVITLYKVTEKFPKREDFNLTSQIRRAAVSIPSNIAEGRKRESRKMFKRFLSIACGSLAELQTQLEISERLGYISSKEMIPIGEELLIIEKMLSKMITNL